MLKCVRPKLGTFISSLAFFPLWMDASSRELTGLDLKTTKQPLSPPPSNSPPSILSSVYHSQALPTSAILKTPSHPSSSPFLHYIYFSFFLSLHSPTFLSFLASLLASLCPSLSIPLPLFLYLSVLCLRYEHKCRIAEGGIVC